MYISWSNSSTFFTIISAIATVISAIATVIYVFYTYKILQDAQKSTYHNFIEPIVEIFIDDNSTEITINKVDNKKTNPFSLISEHHISIINLGNGIARKIKAEWIWQDDFPNNDSHYSYRDYTISFFEDSNINNIPFLLKEQKHKIDIPNKLISIHAFRLFCDEKEDYDFQRFRDDPTNMDTETSDLTLRIKYEDLSGKPYSKNFKINLTVYFNTDKQVLSINRL